jgi:hypothetical protein
VKSSLSLTFSKPYTCVHLEGDKALWNSCGPTFHFHDIIDLSARAISTKELVFFDFGHFYLGKFRAELRYIFEKRTQFTEVG